MMSETAFLRYAEKYRDMVFRVAFNALRSREDAEDVTQEVLLKLYREEKPFEGEDHVKHWLLRVALNECKKLLRSPWRRKVPMEDCLEGVSMPSQEHLELLDAVMRLKPKYRVAIYLYYYEDCTAEEIGRLLGVPRATVLTRLHRAREALKKELTEAEK